MGKNIQHSTLNVGEAKGTTEARRGVSNFGGQGTEGSKGIKTFNAQHSTLNAQCAARDSPHRHGGMEASVPGESSWMARNYREYHIAAGHRPALHSELLIARKNVSPLSGLEHFRTVNPGLSFAYPGLSYSGLSAHVKAAEFNNKETKERRAERKE